MNRALLYKIGAIALLALILIIPLRIVGDLIGERRGLRDGVLQDIARSGTGAQRLEGMAVVLPCTDHYDETETLENGRTIVRQRTRSCNVYVLPERLVVKGDFATDFRYRGIYQALVYRTTLGFSATFDIPATATPAGMHRQWGTPHLAVGIADVRGIGNAPTLRWNDEALAFESGTGAAPWARGIQAPVPIDPMRGGTAAVSFDLDLAGMERLDVVPAARDVRVELSSAWPHPSFIGRFLPRERTVSDAGFQATWRMSDLGTNIRQAFRRCTGGRCDEYSAAAFGVSLIQTADVYQQAYRALHYGFLFVLLTFALFFLYEVLAGRRVHPIQYGLVGVALTTFFVLLVALAEHVAFGLAYLIAACACIALIVAYVRYVLATWARAAGLGTLLAALYATLYLVLGSEDYALLMGSTLLFGALAAFMLVTRRLDWYALPSRPRPPAESAASPG